MYKIDKFNNPVLIDKKNLLVKIFLFRIKNTNLDMYYWCYRYIKVAHKKNISKNKKKNQRKSLKHHAW